MAGKNNKGRGGKQTGGNKGPAANPGAKGGKGGGAPAPAPDAMAGVSGGGTRGKVPVPAGAQSGQPGQPKEELVTWATGELPWWVVSVVRPRLVSVECF
jgi:hypothetical protein